MVTLCTAAEAAAQAASMVLHGAVCRLSDRFWLGVGSAERLGALAGSSADWGWVLHVSGMFLQTCLRKGTDGLAQNLTA
jgi:hypothetical protein